MNTHATKFQENKSASASATRLQMKNNSDAAFHFVDNRPEAVSQRKLQEMANNSLQAKQSAQLQTITDTHSVQQLPAQKKVNSKEGGVLQGYFDTEGYTWARKVWTDAEQYAIDLDKRLDLRVKRGDSYVPALEKNLNLKSKKAGGTLAGEAYETFQWDQPKGTSVVYGPGGSSGGDLMTYESLKIGNRAKTPTYSGEVKSASSLETYKTGIANAHHERGQSYIIMYATDESIAPDLLEFERKKINYAVTDRYYPNGSANGKTYTYVATIELPDQSRYQYLYTWV